MPYCSRERTRYKRLILSRFSPKKVQDELHLANCSSESSIALKELNKPIKPAPILLKEARRWLSGIRRRIGGKRKDPKSILRGDKSRLSV